MLLGVGAYYLDLHGACLRTIRYTDPSISAYVNGIDAICDNISPHAQVILRNDLRDTIARVIKRSAQHPGRADRLLNRINAQIYRSEFTSEFLCNRRFAYSG